MNTRAWLTAVMISAIPGCGGDDPEEVSPYPGDSSAAIRSRCEEENAGQRECEGDCILAQLNLACPASAGLEEVSDFGAFLSCRDACAVVRSCDTGRRFHDCDCTVRCAERSSEKLQGLLAFDADCESAMAGPRCR